MASGDWAIPDTLNASFSTTNETWNTVRSNEFRFSGNNSCGINKSSENTENAIIFTQSEATAVSVVIVALSILGLLMNSVTFLTIASTKNLRKSVFNTFIMSLCVSDLLSAISSPFQTLGLIYSVTNYPFSTIVCKLHTATDVWTTIATIHHILAFALLRLGSITFPHKIKLFTPFACKVAIFLLWAETFGLSFVPYFVFLGVYRGSTISATALACRPDNKYIMVFVKYITYSYPVIFYLPMALVVLCSSVLIILMIRRKWRKNKRGIGNKNNRSVNTKDENSAIIQLSLILFSFMVGYIPDVARRLFNANRTISDRSSFLFYLLPICSLRISECLNPIFYNIASSSMRRATYQFLKTKCLCCWFGRQSGNQSREDTRPTPNETGSNSNRQTRQTRLTI